MTWQEGLGKAFAYVGDLSGISDIGDEYNTAKADGDISLGEWGKIIWQAGQVPTESMFIAPFKMLYRGGIAYEEEVLQPLWGSLLLTAQAPAWKKPGQSYGEYLQQVRASTWGSDPGEENWISGGDVMGGAIAKMQSAAMGVENTGDIMDPVFRRALRSDPFTGKVVGTYDFLLPFLDPLFVVGPVTKAAKGLSAAPKLVKASEKAAAGWWRRPTLVSADEFKAGLESGNYASQVGRIAAVEDDLPGYLQMASEWGVNDPASFAYLANRVKGEEDATALLRLLADGDTEAAALLRERYGPGFELTAKNASGQFDNPWRQAMASGEEIVFDPDALAAADDLVRGMDESADGKRMLDEAMSFHSGIDKLADPARPNTLRLPSNEATWMGRRQVKGQTKRMDRAGRGVATRREVVETVDETGATIRTAKLVPYRPHAAHPASWFLERPSGLVRPENADSYKEILAQIREIDRVTGGQMTARGYGNLVMEEWAKASTLANPQSARGMVAHKLNELSMSLLAEKHGITDPKMVQALFEKATAKSSRALSAFREKGWLALTLDDGTMGLIRSPLLQRTTPNSVQMWDMVKMDRAFKRWNADGTGKVLRVLLDGTIDATDALNSLFKISVLMRLGYTIRNLSEAAWSIAATGNLGHVLSAVGEDRLRTMMNPLRKTGARLIDRVATRTGHRLDVEARQGSIVEQEGMLAATDRMRSDMLRMIGDADLGQMIMSGDEVAYRTARQIARARTRLQQEGYTWHAASKEFVLDPDRPLATTGSQSMATRMADQQWETLEVAQFSSTGTKRGLQGPHPDIGRGTYGARKTAQYHGGPRWAGDHPDPDLRGDVAPDQTKFKDDALAAPGLYTTDSAAVGTTYVDNARLQAPLGEEDDAGQLYTVIWNHFRPPVMLDGDKPVGELVVVQNWLDEWFDDLRDMVDVTHAPGHERGMALDALDEYQRLAKDPTTNMVADWTGTPSVYPPVVRDMVGQINEVLDLISDPAKLAKHAREQADLYLLERPLTPPGGKPDFTMPSPEDVAKIRLEAVKTHIDDIESGAMTPAMRRVYDDIRSKVDDLIDDYEDVGAMEDLATLIDDLREAGPAAYQWGHGSHQSGSFLAPATNAMNRIFMGDYLTALDEGGILANEFVVDPKVRAFMEKWFGVKHDLLQDAWADNDIYRWMSQRLTDRWQDLLDTQGMYEMTWGKVNRAFADYLSRNGFDGVRHTGGLNATDAEQHGVMIFLRADDVRVVGNDWRDYDNQKVLAAAREMALELRDRLQAGQRVRRVDFDRRAGKRGVVADDLPGLTGYKEVTLAEAEQWVADPVALTRAFGYNPKKPSAGQNFRKMFQTLDPEKAMEVTPLRSYGRELDLSTSDWQAVPQEVRDIMGWKRTRGKTKTGKQRSGSFSRDMRAIRNGDTETRDRVARALHEAGYQRLILPDSNAFGGRQVVVNPKYVGDAGLEASVDDLLREIEQGVRLPEPAGLPAMSRRQVRAANRGYRKNGNPDPKPIIDAYEARLGQTMANNGLDDWVEELLTSRARITDELDQLRSQQVTALAARSKYDTAPGFATGDVRIRSEYGEDYAVAGPLGGHSGELWARMTSSDDSNHRLFLQSDLSGKVGGGGVPTTVTPDDPRYYEGWSNILNKHFRDEGSMEMDPIVQMFLEGRDVEDVIKWATTTPEGYQWAESIGLSKSSTAADFGKRGSVARRAEAIEEARAKVSVKKIDPETIEEAVVALDMATTLYLPEGPVREAFRTGQPITADWIRTARRGLPEQPLHGLLIPTSKEARRNWAMNDYMRLGAEKAMRALGTLPETSMMRHPLFATLARDEYARRIGLAEEAVGRRLTAKEVNRIIHDSRQQAKADLERTLYTVVRKSGFAENTRLLFPFGAAYENSLRRWGSFIKDDPALPLKAGNLVAKVTSPFPVMDSEGNPQTLDQATFDSYLVLPGLDSLAKFVPGKYGRALESQTQNIHVSLRSLDLITQGEPFNPGLGPFALLPVAEVLKRRPDAETLLGWTMPYGVPADAIDLFMPTAMRRIKSMITEDSTYTNAFTSAYLYQQWLYENGRRDTAPTMKEIEDTTNSFYVLRILTNLTAPFSVQYTNERDWYVSKLRQYRAAYEDQREAEARFFADFPDVAMLVQSLSANPAGALATPKAFQNLTEYQQEVVDAYALGDPELAGFIANYGHDPTQDEFSGAVYRWEREYTPVPGSARTLREVRNPEEAVREAHVAEGWATWRKYVESAEAQLVTAGIGPDSPGWEAAMSSVKTGAAEAIYATGNTDWWFEYKNPDTSKYFRRAQYFEELVSDSQFMEDHREDPLMRSISNYLALRRRYQDGVNYLAAQGGQRSLSGDLERQWNATVAQMRLDSPEFAAWLDRFFMNDPVVGGQPIARAA